MAAKPHKRSAVRNANRAGPSIQDRLTASLHQAMKDLPDSDYQNGYLAGHVELAREFGVNDPRILEAATALLGKVA